MTHYHQQQLVIAKEIGNRSEEADALGSLGIAYGSLGQYKKAIDFFQQSLAIQKEIGDRNREASSLNNLGKAYNSLGQYPEATKVLREAIKIYETLRVGLTDPNKISILETQLASYRLLQQALIAQNKTNQALEISERGRARAFVELLASRLANNPDQSSIKPPTIQQIQQIAQQQNATLVEYSLTFDALYIWVIQPTGQITFHKTDLPSLNAALTALVDASREAIGVRAGGIVPVALPYRPGDLVRLNDDDKYGFKAPWQVIQYDPVNELLTLTNPQMNDGTQELPRPISDVLQKVTSARISEKSLQDLYQLLIKPIADQLPTDPNKPIIFIPHGELFVVPFTALQDEQGKYLIEKHTILTASSIQVLELTRQQKTARSKEKLGQPLVMGNPTMPTVPLTDPPQQLPPLPGAEIEAKAIAQELGTQPILGNKATKATLVPQMEKAGIIHLATHGLLDDYKQLGTPGAIALAPTDEKQDPLSGFLTSGDIFEMKLKADLVVLSACNTGQGRISGDGVIGLSRSFISAGVPSIIVSLWSVPDAPTAELMERFYENKKTMNKAQALRQAMLETMKTHPKPVDWAAFTIIGEAN